ncbi:hypothetical protein [Acinetobacter sp. A47]|uniref:hypothetical protein n=1 Tax=Acinetobacter sp. A47 TaxID=1561217 RepID=UPI000570270B|nr:hypothetical protein [Acinetobacter sp. A47]
MKYLLTLIQEGNYFLVSSQDIPELNSVGESVEDALKEALDGIESAFMIYMEDRIPIPLPSARPKEGEYFVTLPLLVAAKVYLYNEMLAQNVTKAELARRLDWQQKQADRLLSLKHATKIESIENAFHAMGRELDLQVA